MICSKKSHTRFSEIMITDWLEFLQLAQFIKSIIFEEIFCKDNKDKVCVLDKDSL